MGTRGKENRWLVSGVEADNEKRRWGLSIRLQDQHCFDEWHSTTRLTIYHLV